jgi:hypothetical protein
MPEPSRDPQLPRLAGDTAPAPPTELEPVLPGTFTAESLLRRLDELAAEADGEPVTEGPPKICDRLRSFNEFRPYGPPPPEELGGLLPGLLWLLRQEGDARDAGREALRWLGAAAVPGLVSVLLLDDLRVRVEAEALLRDIATNAAVPALVAALSDSNATVRARAAEALSTLVPSRDRTGASALSPLVAALADPEPRVRRWAVRLIGSFGAAGSAAIPALRQASERDPDESVGLFAVSARQYIESAITSDGSGRSAQP